jgi:hypothetical protein
VISTSIARSSAIVLFLSGAAMLFAADTILPLLVPGYPSAGLWLGQLLAAALLGLGALNWFSQSTVLGGIYGRPVVMANVTFYLVSALGMLKASMRAGFPLALSLIALVASVFAIVYGWLMMRGPFEQDLPTKG